MTSHLAYCSYQKITLEDINNCLNEVDDIRAEIYEFATRKEVYVEAKVDVAFEYFNRFFIDVVPLFDEEIFPSHTGSVFYFEYNIYPDLYPRLRDILEHILNSYSGFILDDISPNFDEKTKGNIFYYWTRNIDLFRL